MGCSASARPERHKNARTDKRSHRGSSQAQQANFHERYVLGAKIGRGAFAQVRLATRARPSDNCEAPVTNSKPRAPVDYNDAVKIVDLRANVCEEASKSQEKAVRSESTVWQTVGRHPNIVLLIEVFSNDQLYYFVMEKCSGSLLSALQHESEFNERTLGFYLYQMAQGIEHVHSRGVVHRDIKPDNFLVAGPDSKQVKLGDFGLSAVLPKGHGLGGIFGTAPFMCPEMLETRNYGAKADVWSFAVIVYVFLFGSFPYTPKEQSSKAMKKAIVKGEPTPSFEPAIRKTAASHSFIVHSFVKSILVRDPEERPTSSEMLQSPYMLQAGGAPNALPWPETMPSLRPMLHAAKKAGAFENRDIVTSDSVDYLLNKLQMKYQSMPLTSYKASRRTSNDAEGLRGKEELRKSPALKPSAKASPAAGKDSNFENHDASDTSSTRSSDGTGSMVFRNGSGWSRNNSTPTMSSISQASEDNSFAVLAV